MPAQVVSQEIDSVAVIWGEGTSNQHQLPVSYGASYTAFSGNPNTPLRVCGDGDSVPAARDVQQLLKDFTAAAFNRRLLVGIMDGWRRDKVQPAHLWHSGRDAPWLLRSLASALPKASPPVDVFLLVARKTDFIHALARQLPRGSTVVAVRMRPNTVTDSWVHSSVYGLDAAGNRAMHWATPPAAKDLLIDLMASGKRGYWGVPDIAVSGCKRIHLNELWHEYASQRQLVDTISLHGWSQRHANRGRLNYLAARYPIVGRPVLSHERVEIKERLYLALAAECFDRHETASRLRNMFTLVAANDNPVDVGVVTSVPVVQASAPPIERVVVATVTEQPRPPAQRAPVRRLTGAEITALPKRLQPFAHALPASTRRRLQKG